MSKLELLSILSIFIRYVINHSEGKLPVIKYEGKNIKKSVGLENEKQSQNNSPFKVSRISMQYLLLNIPFKLKLFNDNFYVFSWHFDILMLVSKN